MTTFDIGLTGAYPKNATQQVYARLAYAGDVINGPFYWQGAYTFSFMYLYSTFPSRRAKTLYLPLLYGLVSLYNWTTEIGGLWATVTVHYYLETILSAANLLTYGTGLYRIRRIII